MAFCTASGSLVHLVHRSVWCSCAVPDSSMGPGRLRAVRIQCSLSVILAAKFQAEFH